MYRRKVTVAAAAVFAIGVAFAAQRHPCGRIGSRYAQRGNALGAGHEYLDVGPRADCFGSLAPR